jgi:rhodanese-related sulfurtransferase
MRTVNHREVVALLESGADLVETLPIHEYQTVHIRGAINLPLKSLWGEAAALLSPGRPIVVYCRDSL